MKHWVLIVDAASSTVYATDELFAQFAKVEHESAAHAAHAAHGHGDGVHRAHQPHADAHAADRARFAHQVARRLDDAAREGAFERLVIVAPPRFLGEVRDDLSPKVRERVVAFVPHDLSRTPIRELPAAVRRHLPETAGMGA